MKAINSIPTNMPTRMFIEILFVKVKGTENNTTVHEKRIHILYYIHIRILYSSENKGITAKCNNMMYLSGTMLNNKTS